MFCDRYASCPNRQQFSCHRQDVHPSLPYCIRIADEFHVQVARRHALTRAELVGMNQLSACYIATAVSELANNLFFHTDHGGVIQFHHIRQGSRAGIEIIAQDDGPGIASIDVAMTDGFSSNGGLGSGLGGVKRLMDEFHIESEQGKGTRITARKWLEPT